LAGTVGMRTLWKVVVLWLVGVVVVTAGAGVAYLLAKYPDVPPPEDVKIVATDDKVARASICPGM